METDEEKSIRQTTALSTSKPRVRETSFTKALTVLNRTKDLDPCDTDWNRSSNLIAVVVSGEHGE